MLPGYAGILLEIQHVAMWGYLLVQICLGGSSKDRDSSTQLLRGVMPSDVIINHPNPFSYLS